MDLAAAVVHLPLGPSGADDDDDVDAPHAPPHPLPSTVTTPPSDLPASALVDPGAPIHTLPHSSKSSASTSSHPLPLPSSASSSSSSHPPPPLPSATDATASAAPEKTITVGPHLFDKNKEGAANFREILDLKFPKKWKETFGVSLLDKNGRMLYKPKGWPKNQDVVFLDLEMVRACACAAVVLRVVLVRALILIQICASTRLCLILVARAWGAHVRLQSLRDEDDSYVIADAMTLCGRCAACAARSVL